MGRFTDLSTEVILEILKSISSAKDLAALSVQCKRFNQLSDMKTRARFHSIRITTSTLPDVYDRIIELLKDPALRAYVQEIVLVNGSPATLYAETKFEGNNEDEEVKLVKAGYCAGRAWRDNLRNHACQGHAVWARNQPRQVRRSSAAEQYYFQLVLISRPGVMSFLHAGPWQCC
jgi:hypothetical protein